MTDRTPVGSCTAYSPALPLPSSPPTNPGRDLGHDSVPSTGSAPISPIESAGKVLNTTATGYSSPRQLPSSPSRNKSAKHNCCRLQHADTNPTSLQKGTSPCRFSYATTKARGTVPTNIPTASPPLRPWTPPPSMPSPTPPTTSNGTNWPPLVPSCLPSPRTVKRTGRKPSAPVSRLNRRPSPSKSAPSATPSPTTKIQEQYRSWSIPLRNNIKNTWRRRPEPGWFLGNNWTTIPKAPSRHAWWRLN